MQLSDFINQALKNIQRGAVDRKSKFRFPVLAHLVIISYLSELLLQENLMRNKNH